MSNRVKQAPLTNPVAEKACLGALLRSPYDYWKVVDTVRAEDFATPFHRDLYGAIASVMERNQSFSFAVIESRLPPEVDGQDTTALLYVLHANAEGLNASEFAEAIAETASRRRLIAISEQLHKAATAGDKAAIDIAGVAETAILDVMQVSSPRRPKRIGESARQVMTAANKAIEQEVLPGLMWGLPSLDEIMGIVLPGDLIFLIASQGDGKTALAGQFGAHVARSRPVLMCQLEMSDEQIAARELAAAAGVSVREINEGQFNAFQFEQLREAEQAVAAMDFWILDVPDITTRQLRAHCLAMQRTTGLGLLIIDQLDKVKGEGWHKDKFERGAEVTRSLKVMAKELRLPILCLAQRTRSAQRRDDPTPDILDTDYPSIERDGDSVLGLWRRSSWLRRNRPNQKAGGEEMEKWEAEIRRCQDQAEIISLKRRRGRAYEQRKLKWLGENTRFAELG